MHSTQVVLNLPGVIWCSGRRLPGCEKSTRRGAVASRQISTQSTGSPTHALGTLCWLRGPKMTSPPCGLEHIADTDILSFIFLRPPLALVCSKRTEHPAYFSWGVSADWRRCRALTVLQRLGLASRSRSRGLCPASTGAIYSQLQHCWPALCMNNL